MVASCARRRARFSPLNWALAIGLLACVTAPASAAPPEPIVVMLDQSRLLQLPERAVTVVVGNPLIADLSIQPGGLAVVTGKSYGATNFTALDRSGAVLMEKMVEVTGPSDPIVVVYRGDERETYSCTPECARRLTLGDNPEYFDKTLAQITTRNSQAISAGASASGR